VFSGSLELQNNSEVRRPSIFERLTNQSDRLSHDHRFGWHWTISNWPRISLITSEARISCEPPG